MKTDILLAAYQYAALSLNIIPVCSGDHSGMTPNHRATCRSPGKQPLITNWPNNGVPDKQQIDDWFRRWPTSNIGLVLGSPSGIVAIDIDGPFGHKELLHISNGDIPETWQFSTPGGGMHYLFPLHPIRSTRGSLSLIQIQTADIQSLPFLEKVPTLYYRLPNTLTEVYTHGSKHRTNHY